MTVLLILLAIVLPPLAVYLVAGMTIELLIAVVLSLLGYVPGVLYALWVVLSM